MNDTARITITEDRIFQAHSEVVAALSSGEMRELSKVIGIDLDFLLRTSIAESLQTLRLLTGVELPLQSRVLEVGAGFGIASLTLAKMGFAVTALEPGGIGFENNREAVQAVAEKCEVRIESIDQSAEDFDFSSVRKFDLILSNNVLEHIGNLEQALGNLYGALDENGVFINSCPNYTFPFEPHFGVPLVPIFPRLTRYLLPKSISSHGVWKSLNFVTATQIRSHAKVNGMSCGLRKGTMSSGLRRLLIDVEFAERHPKLSRIVQNRTLYRLLSAGHSIPPVVATPMDFVICHRNASQSPNVVGWLRQN